MSQNKTGEDSKQFTTFRIPKCITYCYLKVEFTQLNDSQYHYNKASRSNKNASISITWLADDNHASRPVHVWRLMSHCAQDVNRHVICSEYLMILRLAQLSLPPTPQTVFPSLHFCLGILHCSINSSP